MQEDPVSLQLLEFGYCHMSSRTYSQHQATNRNDDKQAFKEVGAGVCVQAAGRQAKPRGKQALHNPTVASKAVLTGTRNNNTTSVSHRTPIQHIAKPQRCALYIHC